MKKRVLIIVLAALMLLTLVSCGKKGIEGKWKYDSGDAGEFSEYGEALTLTFKSGKMTMDIDAAALGMSEEDAQYISAMFAMLQITYKVKSDTELELTISAMGQSETETVEYSVDGDTLTFDGAVFKRQ